MDALALTFSSGWASGINAYLVVLVLGIADRVGSFTDIPDALGGGHLRGEHVVIESHEVRTNKIHNL